MPLFAKEFCNSIIKCINETAFHALFSVSVFISVYTGGTQCPEWIEGSHCVKKYVYRQLRARMALLQLKDVPLITRRALLLYKFSSNSALLVLNGTSLICNNALLALS